MRTSLKAVFQAVVLVGMASVVAHAVGGNATDIDTFLTQAQTWIIRVFVIGVGGTIAIFQAVKMSNGDPNGVRNVGIAISGVVLGLFIPTIINILAGFAGVR